MTMTYRSWIWTLALLVTASLAVQLVASASALVAAISGLFLVVGGTLLVASLSHSPSDLVSLPQALRGVADSESPNEGLGWFLEAADCYRRGNIRLAEQVAQRIDEPLLRNGVQLVVDGFHRDQVSLALQSLVTEEREALRRPVELLRAMAGYAPAFGMLGTLFGLMQMLFSLGSGDLASLGGAMGFAMLTTVYGLVLSNLVLKPIAMKLDLSIRSRLGRRAAQAQAVLMLFDRQHSALIREVVEANGRQSLHTVGQTSAASVQLVAASR